MYGHRWSWKYRKGKHTNEHYWYVMALVDLHAAIYWIITLSHAGAGIYAQTSQYSNTIPISNNTAIVYTPYRSYTRYDLYCMSNASSTSASVVYAYSSSYMSRTNCGAGCYQLYYRNSYFSLSSTYQGIHTCRIQDSSGVYLDVHFGIYPNRFNCKWSFMSLSTIWNIHIIA